MGSLPYHGNWIAVNPVNPQTIYVTTLTGLLMKSTNGGSAWTQIWNAPNGNMISQVTVDPANPTTVYTAVTSFAPGKHVWKSTNEGSTWTNITGDLPDLPVDAIRPDRRSSNMLYLGTDLGMFYTTNGGTNWIHDETFPNTIVNDLGITSDSNLVALTYGRGMLKSPLPVIGAPSAPTMIVTAPNGGENWTVGTSQTITWSQSGVSSVKIEYSTNGGSGWSPMYCIF